MVRILNIIELPSFNIQRGELALNRKKLERLLGIAVVSSATFLIYIKSEIQPTIEAFIEKTLFSIPFLGPIFQIDYIKVGLVAALIFYIKDVID